MNAADLFPDALHSVRLRHIHGVVGAQGRHERRGDELIEVARSNLLR
ncbi:hypothetical protein [Inquilinus sp. OTU3971]